MTQTDMTNPELTHALSLVLNSEVTVAHANRVLFSERPAARQEDSAAAAAARHLDTLKNQFDILCNDLYLVTPPGSMDDLLNELYGVIARGDEDTAERIRDRELAKFSPEVSRVRDVDAKIKGIETKINLLRTQLSDLEEERAHNATTAVWAGFTADQIAEATDRDVDAVNEWVRGV